ncbi:MAG: hypothetical protein K2J48_05375 [Muribaculaceae bacterium]|nr:hypothetical protein [Muribaculaceae bacterium]
MNKPQKYGIYSWLVILTVISIVSLSRTFYQDVTLQLDYSGILVGILGALCTLLVGWQIYSLIDFNERERKNQKKIAKLLEIIKSMKENGNRGDYLLYENLSEVYENIISQNKDKEKFERIHFKINAINYAARIEEYDTCVLAIEIIENFIILQNPCFCEDDKNRLLKYACSIPHQQGIKNFTNLINALSSIKTKA